jgi:phage shock protein E
MKTAITFMALLWTSSALAQTPIFIDVRSPGEYDQGHVEGAELIPHNQIEPGIARLQPGMDTTLYVYCRSGYRAGVAADALRALGYTRVVNLKTLENARQAAAQLQLCAKSSDAPGCNMPGMPGETTPAASALREG